MTNEKVKRVQELRRSNAATPQKNKKKYTRKTKHKKNKSLKLFSDLVSPFFKQFNIQLNGPPALGRVVTNVIFITGLERLKI